MKNILVTGGAGFIGSHTVVELVNAGYNPVIIDNLCNSESFIIDRVREITGKNIPFYKDNMEDAGAVREIIKNEQIDGVIHFAAFMSVQESVQLPLKYYANNVAGFISLLQTLEDSPVESIVLSSSCTVYGNPDVVPVTEDAPVKEAVSPYGASKQIDEIILKDALASSTHLKGIALRYFNPIGAHASGKIGENRRGVPPFLVPYLMQAVEGKQQPLTVYGDDYDTPDGTCIRDYIHVVDLAQAHIKALVYIANQTKNSYETCNIGTGKGTSVLEVIKTFEKINSIPVPYSIGPRRPGDAITVYASPAKAEQMLGWKNQLSLADALRDAWRWQQELNQLLAQSTQ